MPLPAADWYPDPQDHTAERWWDGTTWSTATRPVAHPASALMPAPPMYTQPHALVPAPPHAPQYVMAPHVMAPPPTGVWRSPVDTRPYVRGMGDAVRVVFQKYAQFEGRATRAEYWYFQLFVLLCVLGLYALLLFTLFLPLLAFLPVLGMIGGSLAILVPSYAVLVRRLRDAGYHWAWLFLGFAPFGGIVLIVFCCQPSKFP